MRTTSGSAAFSSTLLGHRAYIDKCDIILASKSPRRKDILDWMGIGHRVQIRASTFEENLDKALFPSAGDYAVGTARYKAAEVAAQILQATDGLPPSSHSIIVGADSIVDIDGRILEKPKDNEDAAVMLRALSGRSHLVHTGVAIFTSHGGSKEPAALFCETTKVTFVELHDDEIQAYIATGQPMNKSGAYGIQTSGGQFISSVEGCYFNVLGFPMARFSSVLAGLLQEGRVNT